MSMEGQDRLHTDAEPGEDVTKITGSPHCTGETTAVPGWSGASAEPRESHAPCVLLVGKCGLRETGNATTLARFRRAVECGGWEAVTQDPDSIPDTSALHALITNHSIVIVLGLHAYRSAHVLLSCQELGVPYVTVFGGTDMNECVRDAAKREVMGRVVDGAQSLVAFHSSMRDAALQVWPSLPPDKIWLIPQAVEVNPDLNFDVLSYLTVSEAVHGDSSTHNIDHETNNKRFDNQNAENFVQSPAGKYERIVSESQTIIENACPKENVPPPEDKAVTAQNGTVKSLTKGIPCQPPREVFSETLELPTLFQPLVLLVAGLRPVKDVLYLTEVWSKWQQDRGGRGRFLILGPSLDPEYAAHVCKQVERLSGVRVCPSLPRGECQAVMRSATLLVNSSRSESMPNAIMEAMALGTPVIARDIPGNTSLIRHGHTGLLYSSPDAFIRELDCLLQDTGLRDRLVTAAKDHVTRFHSLQQEKDLLLRILQQAVQ